MSAEPSLSEQLRGFAFRADREADDFDKTDSAVLRAAADRLDAQRAAIEAARKVQRHFGSRFSGPVLTDLSDALDALAALDRGDR